VLVFGKTYHVFCKYVLDMSNKVLQLVRARDSKNRQRCALFSLSTMDLLLVTPMLQIC
jgi:hypothetical protein